MGTESRDRRRVIHDRVRGPDGESSGPTRSADRALAASGSTSKPSPLTAMTGRGPSGLIVDDAATTRRVLSEAALMNEERTVLTAQLPHRPGELARRLADAGVNIDALRLAVERRRNRIAISIDQADEAMPELPITGGALGSYSGAAILCRPMFSSFAQCAHKVISILAGAVLVLGIGTDLHGQRLDGHHHDDERADDDCSHHHAGHHHVGGPHHERGSTISPINGMPVDDLHLLDRRLLAVKVDNHPNARPQSGINLAMVFEIRVEGITRFLTLCMQSDADFLGPMRSGRPTRRDTAQPSTPTFAISAQGWVQAMITSMNINLLTDDTGGPGPVPQRPPQPLHDHCRAESRCRRQGLRGPASDRARLGVRGHARRRTRQRSPRRFRRDQCRLDVGRGNRTWLRSTDGAESNWRRRTRRIVSAFLS